MKEKTAIDIDKARRAATILTCGKGAVDNGDALRELLEALFPEGPGSAECIKYAKELGYR